MQQVHWVNKQNSTMDKGFARITMGNLIFMLYWGETIRQAEVYDTSRNAFELVDSISIPRNSHPFDLIEAVICYGEKLGLTMDRIEI